MRAQFQPNQRYKWTSQAKPVDQCKVCFDGNFEQAESHSPKNPGRIFLRCVSNRHFIRWLDNGQSWKQDNQQEEFPVDEAPHFQIPPQPHRPVIENTRTLELLEWIYQKVDNIEKCLIVPPPNPIPNQ